jgi:hypothetical protein
LRECPAWIQSELTRIGGTNPYGEPMFKLVWSTEPRMILADHEGYKEVRAVTGEQCWALMCWDSQKVLGTPARWEIDYQDENGRLLAGGYPKSGQYRLVQKFLHREIVQVAKERHWMQDGEPRTEKICSQEVRTERLEPCGFILDIMMPGLLRWRKLTDEAKVEALLQEERLEEEEFQRKCKDALEGTKMSRTMRGSQLVQKRAEKIERGMREAMRVAAKTGLGMRMG